MKSRKLALVCSILLLIAALAGCTPAEVITTGAFSGAIYTNEFFDLTFEIPESWSVATKEQMAELFQTGQEAIGSDDKETEKAMKLAEEKTLYLAYASKHPLDYVDGFNPNINVVCENLSIAALVVRSSKDYAEAAIANMEKMIEGASFSDIEEKTIGGAKFSVVDLVWEMQGVEITQQVLCTLTKNYAIVFTLTYFDESELEELQQIVDTISLQ